MTGHYFSNKIDLQEGKCKTKIADDKFVRKIEIIQKGEELVFFGYDVSANGKYIVVWETSLNPLLDKNKQFCLIEKKRKSYGVKNLKMWLHVMFQIMEWL